MPKKTKAAPKKKIFKKASPRKVVTAKISAKKTPPKPIKAVVKARQLKKQLEKTKEQYHALLKKIPTDKWNQKSISTAWTLKELMFHITQSLSLTPKIVEKTIQGRGFNPPPLVANKLNLFLTKWQSRKHTKETIIREYNKTHKQLLTLLPTLTDQDWKKTAKNFGQTMSVEQALLHVKEHFDEHAKHVKNSL